MIRRLSPWRVALASSALGWRVGMLLISLRDISPVPLKVLVSSSVMMSSVSSRVGVVGDGLRVRVG